MFNLNFTFCKSRLNIAGKLFLDECGWTREQFQLHREHSSVAQYQSTMGFQQLYNQERYLKTSLCSQICDIYHGKQLWTHAHEI